MDKQLRILYAAGPGNVIGTYNHWVKGEDDPSQVAITYSSQFFEVCHQLDAQAYVISSNENEQLLHEGRFTIEHRPIPLSKASGILYHLGQLWYGLKLIATAIRFQANVALVANGTTHWFVLSLLPLLGVQTIPSLHCVLWHKYIPPSKTQKLLLSLGRNLFQRKSAAILVVSDEIAAQVAELSKGHHPPILRSFACYRRSQFAGIEEANIHSSPFRVLFVGRIESNKGVFDLLEIAKRFVSEGREDIKFDICGNGSALESLRLAAKLAQVDSIFICHGHCNKPKIRQMYSQAQVVIVPTRKDFIEGFNKVAVEGILSGRPVVVSKVCTDLSYLLEAVVEVTPDDTKAYGDALLKLRDDREFYEQKRRGCLALQEEFYDTSRSWGAKLKSILTAI